jgi:aminoglycoside phosphotransferase (APT) family kinase protein
MQGANSYQEKIAWRKHLFAVADEVLTAIIATQLPGAHMQLRITRPGSVLYVLVLLDGTKQIVRLSCNPYCLATVVAWAYGQWRAFGVPVPNVFASGELNHVQYIRMEYMPGEAFAFTTPIDVQRKNLSQMGAHLAAMRRVACSGYGYLNDFNKGKWASWHEFLRSNYRPHWLVAAGHLELRPADKMQHFITGKYTKIGAAVLLHNDYKPKNMLVDGDDITGLLDPQPMAGDPLWDIALCNHFIYREQARNGCDFDDPTYASLRSAFYDGYQAELGRSLTADEQHTVAGYELLIDGVKTEKLLRYDNNLSEGQYVLDYLHRKLEVFAEPS